VPGGEAFHIHTEHCLVEIVDEDGKQCPSGQLGRILVTTLNNTAMPLIRYDTDDLAVSLDGPCPCGRTLPLFGEIRAATGGSPPCPRACSNSCSLSQILEGMPREMMCGLRQFQVHHSRENIFELRMITTEPLTAALTGRIENAFSSYAGDQAVSLRIVRVEVIPLPASGKFQDFVSDYFAAW
jgi:phenylacetate-CoA ligase